MVLYPVHHVAMVVGVIAEDVDGSLVCATCYNVLDEGVDRPLAMDHPHLQQLHQVTML